MTNQILPPEIEIYEVGARRLYAKTTGGSFAIFEDELTPEELVAIAQDIAARRTSDVSYPAQPKAGQASRLPPRAQSASIQLSTAG